MICALVLLIVVDFQIAFWDAAARLWGEATGRYDEPIDYDATSGAVVEVPEFFRRQTETSKV